MIKQPFRVSVTGHEIEELHKLATAAGWEEINYPTIDRSHAEFYPSDKTFRWHFGPAGFSYNFGDEYKTVFDLLTGQTEKTAKFTIEDAIVHIQNLEDEYALVDMEINTPVTESRCRYTGECIVTLTLRKKL